MADIFDYISWRGDLTFEQDGFNELDALVLSRLSYLLYNQIICQAKISVLAIATFGICIVSLENFS